MSDGGVHLPSCHSLTRSQTVSSPPPTPPAPPTRPPHPHPHPTTTHAPALW